MLSATPRARATGRTIAKLLRSASEATALRPAQPALSRSIGASAPARRTSHAVSSSFSLPRLERLPARRGLATVARDDQFANITAADVEAFAKILPSPSQILTTIAADSGSAASYQTVDPSELDTFNNDWMNKYHGKSQLVLKPKTTQEVSEVMKYCHSKNIAVVPQGGNTGLVGGGVPVFDEVIIQLGGLNQIRSFDEVAGTLVCDAGCILESLDNHIAEKGYMMPLDLGAKGSCHIGGNVATNAEVFASCATAACTETSLVSRWFFLMAP